MEEKEEGGKGEEERGRKKWRRKGRRKEGEEKKRGRRERQKTKENKVDSPQQPVTLQCFDLLQSPPGQTPKNSYVSQLSVHQLSIHPSLRFLAPLPP